MSSPKTGTRLSIEVVDVGLSVDIRGKGQDIIQMLVTTMNSDEKVEDLILESAKHFIKVRLESQVDAIGDDKLSVLLKKMMADITGETPKSQKNEKPYDFSGVEDLLTPEERARL
jgi:hypothetical protein